MNQIGRLSCRNSVYQKTEAKKQRYVKSDSIKLLERMADEAARKRYPNTPPHYLAPRKYSDKNTSELTKAVTDFLKLEGHFCERTGNEGRVIDNRKEVTDVLGHTRIIGSAKRVHGSGMRGTSDLKAVINGQFVAVEIKCAATSDRQSQAQKQYQQSVESSGGLYVIARTFEGFLNWYKLTIREVQP